MPLIKIVAHYENVPKPFKKHPDDVGLDLTVVRWEKVRERVYLLDTGVSAQTPKGYFAELHPRSSIYKSDFMMANGAGIIDPGYRGKLFMPVRYLGAEEGDGPVEALMGKRICQLVLRKTDGIDFEMVETLEKSGRGGEGLGSSGW